MDSTNLDNVVLSLLFAADEPLSVRRIAANLDDVPASAVKSSIEGWRRRFDDEAWSVTIERVAGGYQLSTRPQYAPFIAKLYTGRRRVRLSKAALESLAIIAYKQPITRAEIENVRGVGCGSVLANLMERGLIKITGKARVLGAPFLYGTTQEFLEYLGLNALKDLPSVEALEELLEREENLASEGGSGDGNGPNQSDNGAESAPTEPSEDENQDGAPTTPPETSEAARVGPFIPEPVDHASSEERQAGSSPRPVPPPWQSEPNARDEADLEDSDE
jgi:segregation and condensation protein B